MKDAKPTTKNSAVSPFESQNLPAAQPPNLTLKRRLTMDATSIKNLQEVVARTDSELYTLMMPGFDAARTPVKTWVVEITDLVQSTPWLLICNSLIRSAFERAGTPLVGRYFALRSGDIVAGKRYRHVDIIELELVAS